MASAARFLSFLMLLSVAAKCSAQYEYDYGYGYDFYDVENEDDFYQDEYGGCC